MGVNAGAWPDMSPEPTNARQADSVPQAGAIRTWLARGTRKFGVDPRRGRGGYSQARQLLVEDGESVRPADGVWRDLVSALQRHTVHSGLAQLSQEDRQVLTLAFLQGHTNREIAAMLAVSVRTVSRRLSTALERLEDHVRRGGAWVSSIALLSSAFMDRRIGSIGRFASNAQPASWPNALTATAATVVALSIVALSADSATLKHPAVPPTATSNPLVPFAAAPSQVSSVSPALPVTVAARGGQHTGSGRASAQGAQSLNQTAASAAPGCNGNPTSAAPTVPVGSSTGNAGGAPVTHPTAGGCGPHGAEGP
jgi:DNA-binding CsgD family transcriptional regulator